MSWGWERGKVWCSVHIWHGSRHRESGKPRILLTKRRVSRAFQITDIDSRAKCVRSIKLRTEKSISSFVLMSFFSFVTVVMVLIKVIALTKRWQLASAKYSPPPPPHLFLPLFCAFFYTSLKKKRIFKSDERACKVKVIAQKKKHNLFKKKYKDCLR